MAKTRLDFHTFLLNNVETNNIYFQPPATVRLKYPAVIYNLATIKSDSADDMHYKNTRAYQLTYVTENPDDLMIDKIASFTMCKFDRWFASDNLNHYVYTIFF